MSGNPCQPTRLVRGDPRSPANNNPNKRQFLALPESLRPSLFHIHLLPESLCPSPVQPITDLQQAALPARPHAHPCRQGLGGGTWAAVKQSMLDPNHA